MKSKILPFIALAALCLAGCITIAFMSNAANITPLVVMLGVICFIIGKDGPIPEIDRRFVTSKIKADRDKIAKMLRANADGMRDSVAKSELQNASTKVELGLY